MTVAARQEIREAHCCNSCKFARSWQGEWLVCAKLENRDTTGAMERVVPFYICSFYKKKEVP